MEENQTQEELLEKMGGYTRDEWREMITKNTAIPSQEVLEWLEKEIIIFTDDQLEVLPQETKEVIIGLTHNLPANELKVLNPLIVELLKIKELTKIQYVPLPDDPTAEQKEAHAKSVEKFKAAKKALIEFGKKNADAKTKIKGPLDLLGKEVLKVERSLTTIKDEVLTAIETTFKDFIEAEKEKAAAALEKRNAKAAAAVAALSEENVEKDNIIKKGALMTFLKYEILEGTKADVALAIEKFSLDEVFKLRDGLAMRTFENLAFGKELTLLDEEELASVKKNFENEIAGFTLNLNNRITALQALKDNEKLVDQIEDKNVTFEVVSSPASESFDITKSISEGTFTAPFNPNYNQMAHMEKSTEYIHQMPFVDAVIESINVSMLTIKTLVARFQEEHPNPTDDEKEEHRRVTGGLKMLNTTQLYILNQLPPKAQ